MRLFSTCLFGYGLGYTGAVIDSGTPAQQTFGFAVLVLGIAFATLTKKKEVK